MNLTRINIDTLILLENNPRKITKEQFDKLCKSLRDDPDFFTQRPVLVNLDTETGSHQVYAGNQRILAAKHLGWKDVPCIVEKDLDPELIVMRAIKDNQHYGEWDWDILGNSFDPEMLLDAGFTEDMLNFTPVEYSEEKEKEEKKDEKKNKCPCCGHEY